LGHLCLLLLNFTATKKEEYFHFTAAENEVQIFKGQEILTLLTVVISPSSDLVKQTLAVQLLLLK
jgi:hypothetical protein